VLFGKHVSSRHGVGLLCYAAVTGLGQLVVVYVVLATALSMCGLVSNMLILTRWFADRRGRATGVLLMSSSIGGVAFPLIVGYCLEALGWRATMQVLALIALIFALLPIVLWARDFPNALAVNPVGTQHREVVQKGPTVRQAIVEPRFYLVALATAAVWFSLIGMTQHQSLYLVNDVGIERSLVPTIFSTFFFCSMLGKPFFGWLSDHVNKPLMMLASIATMALGLLLLRNVHVAGPLSLYGYAIVAGVGFGGAFTMIQLLFAEFYAGTSYGKILAILVMVDTVAGALGTRVLGLLRETGGSYLGGIDLMIGLLALAFVCILIVRPGSASRILANTMTEKKHDEA
jgi:MFS family permease